MAFDITRPRGIAQQRAVEMLRVLEGNELSKQDLLGLFGGGKWSINQAIFILRSAKLIHIARYDRATYEPIFAVGNKHDAQEPKAKRAPATARAVKNTFKLPPPDPLMTALFAGRRV